MHRDRPERRPHRHGRLDVGRGALPARVADRARGDAAGALRAEFRESIELLSTRGRSPEFDGLFGYAISILDLLGDHEAALTLIGSVLGGTLQNLREMSMPLERTAPNVRDLREEVGSGTL